MQASRAAPTLLHPATFPGDKSMVSVQRAVRPILLCAMLGCGLLAACKFPDDSSAATVGSKGLWIANGTTVVEYIPSQFVSGSSAAAPQRTLASATFGTPQSVTFDLGGNLWVLDTAAIINSVATPAMLEFSAAQIAALGTNSTPLPVAIVTSSNLTSPRQLVFDSSGNGWVTDHDSNTVIVFQEAQLSQPGSNFLNPILVISSAAFDGPSGLAFNGAGDMWVSNNGNVSVAGGAPSSAGTTLVGVLATHVPAVPDGTRGLPTVTADVTLSDDGQSSIQAPWTLAFDSSGNLWSSNANASTIVEFVVASLAATGAPAPTVILSSTMVNSIASLNAPKGLCFDDVGNLAAIDSAGSFGAAYYGEAQLVTGSPAPDTFFVGTGTTLASPVGCTFGTVVD
jgi:hypothetical protein